MQAKTVYPISRRMMRKALKIKGGPVAPLPEKKKRSREQKNSEFSSGSPPSMKWRWTNAPSFVLQQFFVFAHTKSEARSKFKKLDLLPTVNGNKHVLPPGAQIVKM